MHRGHHVSFPHNPCSWPALISASARTCKVQCMVRLQSLSLASEPWRRRRKQTHLFAVFPKLNLTTVYGLLQRWAPLLSLILAVNCSTVVTFIRDSRVCSYCPLSLALAKGTPNSTEWGALVTCQRPNNSSSPSKPGEDTGSKQDCCSNNFHLFRPLSSLAP